MLRILAALSLALVLIVACALQQNRAQLAASWAAAPRSDGGSSHDHLRHLAPAAEGTAAFGVGMLSQAQPEVPSRN